MTGELGLSTRRGVWAPVAVTFVALVLWSLHAYLTVRFNSDILVEAIGVQGLLQDPSWVWSYPGQLHGGIVEYPIMAAGELLAPGNPYGFTLIRILYVPLTGVLLALSLRRLFPSVNLWWFAGAAAAGPALMHDFRAISDIYPFGWLLAAVGVYLISSSRFMLVGGLFIGLGVYEHASSALMSIPLVLAMSIRFGFVIRDYLRVGIGIVIGLIPMALAQFTQTNKTVVWAPTDLAPPRVMDMLGLTNMAQAWPNSMLPGAFGIQNGGLTFLGVNFTAQFYLNAALIIALIVACIVGTTMILRGNRTWRDSVGFLVIMWVSGLVLSLFLAALVPTVWFYGLSLGFLVWTTAAIAGRAIAILLIVVMGSMSLYSVDYFTGVTETVSTKWTQQQEIEGVAQSLKDNEVSVIFGDYWEVLPVAYASAGDVFAITSNFNRLPIPPAIAESPEVTVGVATGRIALPTGLDRWTTSAAVEELVNESCRFISPLPGEYADLVDIYRCPTEVLVKGI